MKPRILRILLNIVALVWLGLSSSPAFAVEDVLIFDVAPAPALAVPAPAPVPPAAPAAAPPANLRSRLVAPRADAFMLLPAAYPNPLGFNVNWIGITTSKSAIAIARADLLRQRAIQRRAAVVVRPQPAIAIQNNLQQQMRKMLEPILKAELSFAARAADLNADERRRLVTESKKWFDKFAIDFVKNQDPNQQQMFLQGVRGVWFGGQQQARFEQPRDAVRTGVAKIVNSTFPSEKAKAYAEECQKRDEFTRQTTVDNLVVRIDEKVKLSPDQWKRIAKSLDSHWDKARDPQLEAFVMSGNMWPGAPDQWVLPELSPAQQAVMKRINSVSGRVFFGGGMMGGMFGGEGIIIDDVDFVEVAQPAEQPAVEAVEQNPFGE
jgi:hypothetical protein